MNLYVTLMLIIALIVGIVMVIMPFCPKPNGEYSYSTTDPKSSIDNLNTDGKNMVYAGIGLIIISFVILGLMIKFGK